MAEIVRRKSWGGVLPLGRHASIRGSSFIQCASVSIALSSVQERQTARHHKQFKLEQALAERTRLREPNSLHLEHQPGSIAVGMPITERPPHRSERAQFGHSAPTLGV